MPITPSLRHCSNKYKLAREGEKDKEKDEDFEKVKVQFIYFFIVFFFGYDPEVLRRAPYRTWPRATSDEGYGTVSGSCDVHTCGPGAPLLAVGSSRFLKVPQVGSSRFLYPRLASSATQPVTWPSSSRLHRSRLRRSNTSCLGGQLLPPPSAGCSAQPARRRGRPPASTPAPAPHPQQPPKAVP